MQALIHDHPEIAHLLLDAGANANGADQYDRTALMYAQEHHHGEIVARLLEADELTNDDELPWWVWALIVLGVSLVLLSPVAVYLWRAHKRAREKKRRQRLVEQIMGPPAIRRQP